MKLVIFLCTLCFQFIIIEAKMIEFAHFRDLPFYTKKDTLLILDIDDTLLIPVQMLGCDEWFQSRRKWHQQAGMNSEDALEKSLAEWEAVRHLTKMEIVEPGTEKIIHSLQEKRCLMIGLTTQGLALATRTKQQLMEQQIDLSLTAPSKADHYFQLAGHSILYRHGVLFTSGTHKGEALFQLLNALNYHPKRIVFVNDKASHLTEMETSVQKQGIEFIGLRYGYSDARKKAFRPEIANYQFSHSSFTCLLSDQEAMELYQKELHSEDLSPREAMFPERENTPVPG
jgi:hypothetical protein